MVEAMSTETKERPDTIDVHGIAVELVKYGTGPALLYLHPHIGLRRAEPFLEGLARKFTVYAPSHPGFGRSALPRHITTVDDLAYFYLDLIEQLALDRVTLAGSSFGGWLAAEIATKASPRLARLVLIDALGIRVSSEPDNRDIVDFFATKQAELDGLAYHDPKHALLDHNGMSDEDAYIHFRNRESAALFAWSPYMHNPKLKGRLHRVHVPTLVLWGDSDHIATANYGRRFGEAIPGARFDLIERAGHFPHIEQPDAVVGKIIAFAGE